MNGTVWRFVLDHLGLGSIGLTAIIGAVWTVYTQWDKGRVKLHITQSGSNITNRVCATQLGMTDYRAEVKIINDSTFPVVLRGFDLQLPWKDQDFTFLPDPREAAHPHDYYQTPTTALKFPLEEVINHRTFKSGKMEPGDVLEGFVLAMGTTGIPSLYRQGDEIEMKLSVYDQRGKPHSIPLTFWVDLYERRFARDAN
jgi:hypothetical protein